MAERITQRDLDGLLGTFARCFGKGDRPFQIHSESGLTILDEMEGPNEPERWRIHHRIHTAATKRELYDYMHAWLDCYWYLQREEVSQDA